MVQPSNLAERAAEADELPNPRDIVGEHEEIPVTDIFDEAFIQANTDFGDFDQMVAASPSEADSAADLELVPDGTWDEFVAETTVFADEEEMVFAARDHWVETQLGL
ncbi:MULTISPECIES: hypothetical protein [Halorubrum]|uniref:Uncharacterized protein n=1 Tax=Halorubrum tropicale TaxID=1765655 RepID=A0A0M9AN67_9EURY|nr:MULTISPECIES: hypothetical protein [Halorubrum]KOX95457.1 hypothetical protein AMR74_15020 [Halorubrum tropicale]MDB2238986.1 hypothetical protein [Halorubrum ezzemoulense]MDB2249723.1 hypothetical protein [Halorubrum ezzemoulense]